MFRSLLILIFFLSFGGWAGAWPREYKVPDLNGDCRVTVSVLGDSFVEGVGDNIAGGYVSRIQKKMPNIVFNQLGKRGLEAVGLLRKLRREIGSASSSWWQGLENSDVIFIDIGRNDRWLFGKPQSTARLIWRIRELIRREVELRDGHSPLVVIGLLMLPNRGSQGPWVKELNRVLLSRHTKANPANLRFDLVSKTLLTDDNLHPSPDGHESLSSTLRRYIRKYGGRYSRHLFIDSDGDGLADSAEETRWATDPLNPDTDGDSQWDGEQLCS